DDVAAVELDELDALDMAEDVDGLDEAAVRALREVGLGDVSGDDAAGAGTEAGEEHLHLGRGGVLGLVEDDEGVRERPAAHVGEGYDLDGVLVEVGRELVAGDHVLEGVVERAEVGIDLLAEVAGEEAEALAGLDGGAAEDRKSVV